MAKLIVTAIAICFSFVGVMPAQTEVIKLSVGSQASEKQQLTRPKNGVNREQVKAQFGEPVNIVEPVGEPPISSWEYPDYFVFFEYDIVIHTVLKHVPTPE